MISEMMSAFYRGPKGHAPLGNVLDFFIPEVWSPFRGFLSNSEKSDQFP